MRSSCGISTAATVLSLITSLALAADSVTPSRTVALLNAGGVTPEALKAIETYVTQNVPLPVHGRAMEGKFESLESVLTAVEKNRTANDAVIMVVADLKNLNSFLLADPDHNIAVVNVALLKSDATKLPGRVNLVSMRALAASLGVGYSLDPNCVNRRVSSVEALDSLGRNFSPPALMSLMMNASGLGIRSTATAKRRQSKEK